MAAPTTPISTASTSCTRQRRRSSAPSQSLNTPTAQSQQPISPLAIVLSTHLAVWQHPALLRAAAELSQKLRLAVGALGHLHVAAEHAARGQQVLLGLDDLERGLDEVRRERRVLAGRLGEVPAVDEHVDEPVAGVDLARHRAVRHRARRLHGAFGVEGGSGLRGRLLVGGCRVTAEHVAVVTVPDLLDGLALDERRHPEVAADDVVHESAHVPLLVGSRIAPLLVLDACDVAPCELECSFVDSGQVDSHQSRTSVRFRDATAHTPMASTIDTTARPTCTALKPNECLGSPTMFLVNTSQTNSVQPTVTRSHSRSREGMGATYCPA